MTITLDHEATAAPSSETTGRPELSNSAAPPIQDAAAPRSGTEIPRQSATATGSPNPGALSGALTGTLIGFQQQGRVPLVLFPGQRGSAAVNAVSTVDLQGSHIGHQVVLVFERGDADRPIIVGLLRGQQPWPLEQTPGQVEVDADGARLIVTAKEQLVLRCGSASITLTKAGKVLIQGEYVSSTSAGVMRIKGGSVQLN